MTGLHIIILIFGAVLGVFLNTGICCIPEGRPIIKFPLKLDSFRTKSTFRFILVEILTVTALILLFYRYGITTDFIVFAYLMSLLIMVFFIDIDHRIVPDELVIAGLAGSVPVLIYNIVNPFRIYGDNKWWNPLAGILPGAGFLFLIVVFGLLLYKTDDAMGMGDVKIFIPIGIFLGWRMCIFCLFISIILAGFASLVLLLSGKKKRKDTIPFGPFIVIGTFITIMWGLEIVNYYFS